MVRQLLIDLRLLGSNIDSLSLLLLNSLSALTLLPLVVGEGLRHRLDALVETVVHKEAMHVRLDDNPPKQTILSRGPYQSGGRDRAETTPVW